MAIRNIREIGDEVLNKKCKEITEMTPRLKDLIGDMLDTMYEANGVGLAAPQVGILKRVVVIDVTGEDPYILINPQILETDGEQTGSEGCLSVPGKAGTVTRPNYVKVKALNVDMYSRFQQTSRRAHPRQTTSAARSKITAGFSSLPLRGVVMLS